MIVAAPGLRAEPKRVTVAADGATNVDVALALGAVNESVVVSAAQVELPLSRVTDSVTVIERAELRTLQTRDVSPTRCASSRASASCSRAGAAR